MRGGIVRRGRNQKGVGGGEKEERKLREKRGGGVVGIEGEVVAGDSVEDQ